MGCAWPIAETPSPAMLKHVKNFAGSVRLAALVYDSLSPDEQQWMCEGLRQISQEIASEGYLTQYGIYATEELKRRCVVSFWPSGAPHDGKLRVPRRFDDLLSNKFEAITESDHEAAEC